MLASERPEPSPSPYSLFHSRFPAVAVYLDGQRNEREREGKKTERERPRRQVGGQKKMMSFVGLWDTLRFAGEAARCNVRRSHRKIKPTPTSTIAASPINTSRRGPSNAQQVAPPAALLISVGVDLLHRGLDRAVEGLRDVDRAQNSR